MVVTQFFGIYRGKLCFTCHLQRKCNKSKISRVFFQKLCPQHPCLYFFCYNPMCITFGRQKYHMRHYHFLKRTTSIVSKSVSGRFHRCRTGQSEVNFLLKYMCQIQKKVFLIVTIGPSRVPKT